MSDAGAPTLKQQQEALRDGRILGARCTTCKEERLSPMVACTKGHRTIEPGEFAVEGTVETFTVQHVASEAFMNEVPFAWAIVRLKDGPRVSGWIPFVAGPGDLEVGQAVRFTPSYKPGMRFEKT